MNTAERRRALWPAYGAMVLLTAQLLFHLAIGNVGMAVFSALLLLFLILAMLW